MTSTIQWEFLVQKYPSDKMFMKIWSVFQECKPNWGKIPHSAITKNPLKVLHLDPETDDFQNLTVCSWSKKYIYGKMFAKNLSAAGLENIVTFFKNIENIW